MPEPSGAIEIATIGPRGTVDRRASRRQAPQIAASRRLPAEQTAHTPGPGGGTATHHAEAGGHLATASLRTLRHQLEGTAHTDASRIRLLPFRPQMPAPPTPEGPAPATGSRTSGGFQAAPYLPWPTAIVHEAAKQTAARELAGTVRDGDVIGIGSGSSTYLALQAIAHRSASDHLSIRVAASSHETELAAATLGLPLARLGSTELTWIVDGADEVAPDHRFLKGRGGALFKEKLLWASCRRRYVVVDRSKRVEELGTRFPVPIEVHPNATGPVVRALEALGARSVELRTGSGKDGPVVTESGFLILDARFDVVARGLHAEIKVLPGVLETGIFEGYPATVVEAGG